VIARFRHLLFDNFLLKLASLGIAVLMWYGVAHEPISEITVRVPIEFVHPPKNLDYSSDAIIPQAQVRLRGPARVLRELPADDVQLIVNLKGATAGEHTYDLSADQVQAPHDVHVMQVTPSRLHLVFEQSETRQVAVKPRIAGTLPPGYRIVSITAAPATVSITGPERHVIAVDSALTDAVDVTGTEGVANFDTRAYLPDPLVHLSSSSSIRVTVRTQKFSGKNGAL
jgi:YbbR domain-containing protein